MSTRATVAASIASLGVLVVGWQAGAHAWVAAPALDNATAGQSDTQVQGSASSSSSGTSSSGNGTSQSGGTSAPSNAGASSTERAASGQFAPRRGGSGSGSAGGPGGSSGGTSATLDVPSGASGTFTGTTETNRWGSVTVRVTLASGRITALAETIDDQGDHHSAMINDRAVPTLKQAILAASSGSKVSTISGATYTTKSYLASLQSALDRAK